MSGLPLAAIRAQSDRVTHTQTLKTKTCCVVVLRCVNLTLLFSLTSFYLPFNFFFFFLNRLFKMLHDYVITTSKTSCGFTFLFSKILFWLYSLLLLHQLMICKCFIDQTRFRDVVGFPAPSYEDSWEAHETLCAELERCEFLPRIFTFRVAKLVIPKCIMLITTLSHQAHLIFFQCINCFVCLVFSVSVHCAVKDLRRRDQSMMWCALD